MGDLASSSVNLVQRDKDEKRKCRCHRHGLKPETRSTERDLILGSYSVIN